MQGSVRQLLLTENIMNLVLSVVATVINFAVPHALNFVYVVTKVHDRPRSSGTNVIHNNVQHVWN